MIAFYKEHVDQDKTQLIPDALIYAEYVGYKRYSLIWKTTGNQQVLEFLS